MTSTRSAERHYAPRRRATRARRNGAQPRDTGMDRMLRTGSHDSCGPLWALSLDA